MATDESLEDLNHLTDLVGPELAVMVSNPSVAQPVKHVSTSVVATSTSNSASDMPPDISDLRSQDLLSTLSGVGVDIDRMFEEVRMGFFTHHLTRFFTTSFAERS